MVNSAPVPLSKFDMRLHSPFSVFHKSHLFLSFTACVAALTTSGFAGPAGQAKITRAQAEKVALSRVPDGTIKSAELETEHGRLIWSFDISRPKTANITEIQVDVHKGTIVSLQIETPSEQAKESQTD
jgi:uncharacterized membrane protein YkoI